MIVETQAARLAAARRTDEDVTALEAALEARRAAADGGDAASGVLEAELNQTLALLHRTT